MPEIFVAIESIIENDMMVGNACNCPYMEPNMECPRLTISHKLNSLIHSAAAIIKAKPQGF